MIVSGISIVLLIAGLTIFIVGVRKAIKSKYRNLDCIIWLFSGNALIVFAGLLITLL